MTRPAQDCAETDPVGSLPERLRGSVLPETVESFGEAAWFAWRQDEMRPRIDIRNGVWWRDDGKRVLSLAVGTGLHAFGGMDWETYAFEGAAEGCAEDVCCHASRGAAESCAHVFLLEGRFCTDNDPRFRHVEAAQ